MIKDKMNTIINNLKFSMSNSKISSNIIEKFSILTINNKYEKIYLF